MRTSRTAQDAAKIAGIWSPRRTRSSLLNGSTPSPNAKRTKTSTTTRKRISEHANVKKETDIPDSGISTEIADEKSALSYTTTSDIEDNPAAHSPRHSKRKRTSLDPAVRTSFRKLPAKSSRSVSPDSGLEKVDNAFTQEEFKVSTTTQQTPRLPRKPRAQPSRSTLTETGEVQIHAPPNWQAQYNTCKQMRRRLAAPVDTMGCERQFHAQSSPKDQRFQTLVALMLSSQTKDAVTAAAMDRLHRELPVSSAGSAEEPGGKTASANAAAQPTSPSHLTIANILACPPSTLNNLIAKVGFHNNKTKYIQSSALVCLEQHSGDIPRTPEALMALPGVGPKMAYLCLSAAWGETLGIGVDVHVHRITNLWGWHKTKTPEETRVALQKWLPKDKWHEINTLLVGLGQTVCAPVGRRCGDCDLGAKGICPGVVRTEVKRTSVLMGVGKRRGTEEMVVKEEVQVKEEDAEKVDT